MKISARTGVLVRLVGGGSAGLLLVIAMFGVLLFVIDGPGTVSGPPVQPRSTSIKRPPVCDCGPAKPSRGNVDVDLPLELLTMQVLPADPPEGFFVFDGISVELLEMGQP